MFYFLYFGIGDFFVIDIFESIRSSYTIVIIIDRDGIDKRLST
jgi:hypothetical protein